MDLFPMRTDPRPGNGGGIPLSPLLLASSALLLLLSGCSTTAPHHTAVGTVPDDYRIAHPIMIDERLETMDVPVGIDAGLSRAMRGNVAGFGQRFRASRGEAMVIVLPDGSPNETNAERVGHQVHDILVAAGISPAKLDFRHYRASGKESGAPIRLAYSKIAAHVEGCGKWTDRVEGAPGINRNYGNYGCATQANLAAMVDNPLDLVYPREMAPADAGRRYTVLDAYRQGKTFASEQQLPGGQVSQAVQD